MKKINGMKTKSMDRVRTPKQKIAFALVAALFFLYAGTFIFILGWAFITSLKDKLEFIREPFAWPTVLHFENYLEAFSVLKIGNNTLLNLIFNSAWYSVIS